MEILNNLPKTTTKKSKRVGRGYGSGVGGHTTTRGAKGDKVRGKTKLTFDGTKIKKSWIKRLPFLRGKHRLQKINNVVTLNLNDLNKAFRANSVVDLKSITEKFNIKTNSGIIVKVLSNGELTKALTLKPDIHLSSQAKKKIISAGGKID
ncbi:MAG: 50S ribosomal protein L15 [Patescibacteria group bacterium]|jgi:large subunit ribosomal protein L15